MKSNFIFGIQAIAKDIQLFMGSFLHNSLFLGFIVGFVITVMVVGYILTKNPRNIPLILRYNQMESFQRIAPRDKNGTFAISFSEFVHMYTQVRTLFLVAFISFCVMVTTIVLTQ